MKRVLIIAGPNGAGKTTFARTYLAPLYQEMRFLNADYIAAGLSPFNPDVSAIRAGRINSRPRRAQHPRGCYS